MTQPSERSIWSVPVSVDDVPETGRHVEMSADAQTRAAIAEELELRSLESFGFSFDVTRRGQEGLHVAGAVTATVGQSCVVTLEPIESRVAEDVDVDFLPPGAPGFTVPSADSEADPPEPLVGKVVDLGALAVEFLILGIDPYPRKPGATFANPDTTNEEPGPFAALAKLKQQSDR
jgi:hypothetical protein